MTRKVGTTPYLDALVAFAAPEVDPDLPDDTHPEVWVAARVGPRQPQVGQWLFDFADHPKAIQHLNPSTRKKHLHWARIAVGHLQVLIAGWSSQTGPLKLYLVDRESRRAVARGTSIDHFIRTVVEDPEEQRHGDPAIAAIAQAVAPSTPSRGEWFAPTSEPWYAPVLEPPKEQRQRIAIKSHERWLWHRAAGTVVSVMPKGVRVLDAGGKPKTIPYPFPATGRVHAALSAAGDAVGVAFGGTLARLELSSLAWSQTSPDGDPFFCDIASLEGAWFVVAERVGIEKPTPRLRAFRWTTAGIENERVLTSDDLPDYPIVLGDAELPIAFVNCYPTPTALVVALVGGEPRIAGAAPHPIIELRRSDQGWRAGASKKYSRVG